MSETTSNRASLVSIFAVFALFALFVAVVYYVYAPRQTGAFVGDGIHTLTQRKTNLRELRAKEAEANHYGWVDQKAGVVRLPIERAMELTVQKYAAKP